MSAFRETELAADEQLASLERIARELAEKTLEAELASKEASALTPRLSRAVAEKTGRAPRRVLRVINLEEVRIATPCPADWNKMRGESRVRFCETCEKHVYNISGMPKALAERFLAENLGDVCIRLYRRGDGTLINGDCPEGLRLRRLKSNFGFLAVTPVGLLALYLLWTMFAREVSARTRVNQAVGGVSGLSTEANR